MNIIDILILIVLGVFVIRSYTRGFTAELTAFVSILAGFVLAFLLTPMVGGWLTPIFEDETIGQIIGFLGILLLVTFFIRKFGGALREFWRRIHLGFLDKILGAALGLIKGSIVVIVVLAIVSLFLKVIPIPKVEDTMQQSKLSVFYLNECLPRGVEFILENADLNPTITDD